MSPSLGREWIEIFYLARTFARTLSPSLGREWIEIVLRRRNCIAGSVSLLGEGVD